MSSLRVTSLKGRISGASPTLPDGAVVTGILTAPSSGITFTQTGTGATTTTVDSKLKDVVSVKDFGAVGDGIVDDTAAINRAIKNTYTVDTGGKERRTLYFPGGTYLVAGSSIKLFPHATILGDGPTSTFIKSNDSSLEFVVETVDRLGQTDGNIGNGGAEVPNGIRVQGMCFQTVFDHLCIF